MYGVSGEALFGRRDSASTADQAEYRQDASLLYSTIHIEGTNLAVEVLFYLL